jgi:hypothetical protein
MRWAVTSVYSNLEKTAEIVVMIYSVFIDKVECNWHFLAPRRNCYNMGKLILLFLWSNS